MLADSFACRILVATFALFSLSFLAAAADGTTVPSRPRVAVLEFDARGDIGLPKAGVALAEWLAASLQKTGKYEVLERIFLEKLLEEQSISLSGLFDEATVARVGSLVGAELIATGSIVEWKGQYTLSSRLIDIASGRILGTASLSGADPRELSKRMDDVALVLAGSRPASLLDRETLPGGAKEGDRPALKFGDAFPVLLAERRGVTTTIVVGKGLLDGVAKKLEFAIMMPVYGESKIDGTRVFLGLRRAGDMIVSYVEAERCAGDFLPEPFIASDLGRLQAEAIAVVNQRPELEVTGIGVFSLNAGVSLGLAFPIGPLRLYWTVLGFEAPVPQLTHSNAFNMGLAVELPLVGNRRSERRIGIGAGTYASMVAWDEPAAIADSVGSVGYGAEAHVFVKLGYFWIRLGLRKMIYVYADWNSPEDSGNPSTWIPPDDVYSFEPLVSIGFGY
jgi:TolB-like protein